MSSGDGKAARLKVSFKSTNLRGEGCGTLRRWHKPALSKLKAIHFQRSHQRTGLPSTYTFENVA
jgi:hypothetical protein